jgi:hypothetical protein
METGKSLSNQRMQDIRSSEIFNMFANRAGRVAKENRAKHLYMGNITYSSNELSLIYSFYLFKMKVLKVAMYRLT